MSLPVGLHCRHMAAVHANGVGACRVAACPCLGIPGAVAKPAIPATVLEAVRDLADSGQIVLLVPARFTMAEARLIMMRGALQIADPTEQKMLTALFWTPTVEEEEQAQEEVPGIIVVRDPQPTKRKKENR